MAQRGTKKKDPKHRRKRWLVALAALSLLILGGSYLGDRMLKGRGHPGLRTFIGQWMRNYPASFAVEPLQVSITVEDRDLQQLTSVVEEARERGVIMPEGNEYVPADIVSGSDAFRAKLRIKGKLTDHVQGSKWSFRVVAKKDGGLLGMKRFSLQHPGTRNYLCDWLYHRLMANEGVIALRYGFLRVSFNEEDLGIYAYEEHFGPELLEHNGRLAGPLFRFDPALFWEHRLNQMDKLRFDEPFAAYQAAAVDAFDSSELAKDGKMRFQFEEAVALLDAFRRGELPASEVFDADRIARRHAILDLIGGHHSMDWSDVKFYYDPVAKRVEPIAYESFSAFPLRTLAGSHRWTGRHEAGQDLHDQYFNDERIFRAYVEHLERVSRKSWLDSTFAMLGPALDSASATLYREFPYKELDRSIYYKNQRVIRKLLNGPKPFHAYFGGAARDTVRVTIVPIEGLPMEVHALVLPDGTRVVPEGKAIVPCRMPEGPGIPVEVRFAVKGAVKREGLKLACSVLGASVQREVEVFPYALLNGLDVASGPGPRVDPRALPFLLFDEDARTITIKPGAWRLDRTVVLPAGYRCVAVPPLKLDIVNGAELVSHARLDWKGSEEMPIMVLSTDSSSHGMHVIGAEGRSRLSHVVFSALTRYKADQERAGDVSFHRSDASLEHCTFKGMGATLLDVSVGDIGITDCRFEGGHDPFEAHFAQLRMNTTAFFGMKDDAIGIEGGEARLGKVFIGGKRTPGIGLRVGKGARIDATGLRVQEMDKAIEGAEGARISVNGMEAQACSVIADAKKKEMRYGPVTIELKGVKAGAKDAGYEVGAGSAIILDGKPVSVTRTKAGT